MTIAWLTGGWCLGLLAGAAFGDRWWLLAPGCVFAAATGLYLGWWRLRSALAGLGIAVVAVLAYEASIPRIGDDSVARWAGQGVVVVRGTVAADGEIRGASQRFRLDSAEIYAAGAWREPDGDVLVTTGRFREYRAGDEIEVEGQLRLSSTAAPFDYRTYLLRRGIHAEMFFPRIERTGAGDQSPLAGAVAALRRDIATSIEETLPPVEAGLAQGVLVGRAPALPATVKQQLRATGLSHLVVVSGQNITLAGAFAAALLTPVIGRRRALLGAIGIAWGYALLAGLSPAVTRSAVMVSLAFAALWLGRPGSGVLALGLSGFALTVLDPQVVHDVGFQLSFGAMTGIMLVAPAFSRLLTGQREEGGRSNPFIEAVAVGAAATAGTLPIQIHHFESVSLVALPANLLVVPAFPLMLASAGLSAIAGMLPGSLPGVEVVLALPLRWFETVARVLASFGLVTSSSGAAFAVLGIAYGLTLALGSVGRLGWARLPRQTQRRVVAGSAAVLLVANAGLWLALLGSQHTGVSVDVLDVKGQSVLGRDESGRLILIDAGDDPGRLLQQLSEAAGSGAGRIEVVVVTEGRQDRTAGLIDLLDSFEVGTLIVPGGRPATFTERWLREEFAGRGTRVIVAAGGERLEMDGLVLQVELAGAYEERPSLAVLLRAADVVITVGGLEGPVGDGGIVVAPGERLTAAAVDRIAPALAVVTGDTALEGGVEQRSVSDVGRVTLLFEGSRVSVATDR